MQYVPVLFDLGSAIVEEKTTLLPASPEFQHYFLLFHYQRDTTSPPHDCLLDRIYGTDSWTETKATFDIKILRSILINAAFSSAPHIEIH